MLSKFFPSTHTNTNLPPDWSAVPSDVLEEISKRLVSWDDYVGFRSVCTSWCSAASKRPRLPLLIIIRDCLTLCNFPKPDFYCPPKMPVVISQGKGICGSSRGWIFMEDIALNRTIFMFNPFTGVHIPLPSLPELKLPFKIILSSNPVIESRNCTIVAYCHDNSILHCRLGDASWSPVFYPDTRVFVNDTAFYKGKLYTVVNSYRIFACQVGPDNSMFTEIMQTDPLFHNHQLKQWHLPINPLHPWHLPIKPFDPDIDSRTFLCGPLCDDLEEVETKSYLVVSSGDLLLVDITKSNDMVNSCEVFLVDLSDGKLRLMKLENLGGRALFLGDKSTSFCILVDSSFPLWCRGNCIYYGEGGVMTIVLNLEESSISYMTDVLASSKLWLTPSLC